MALQTKKIYLIKELGLEFDNVKSIASFLACKPAQIYYITTHGKKIFDYTIIVKDNSSNNDIMFRNSIDKIDMAKSLNKVLTEDDVRMIKESIKG